MFSVANTTAPDAPAKATRPCSNIMRRSNNANAKGVGEWMVAQTVIPLRAKPLTTVMTCKSRRDPQDIQRQIDQQTEVCSGIGAELVLGIKYTGKK